jgi:hypothetical protein
MRDEVANRGTAAGRTIRLPTTDDNLTINDCTSASDWGAIRSPESGSGDVSGGRQRLADRPPSAQPQTNGRRELPGGDVPRADDSQVRPLATPIDAVGEHPQATSCRSGARVWASDGAFGRLGRRRTVLDSIFWFIRARCFRPIDNGRCIHHNGGAHRPVAWASRPARDPQQLVRMVSPSPTNEKTPPVDRPPQPRHALGGGTNNGGRRRTRKTRSQSSPTPLTLRPLVKQIGGESAAPPRAGSPSRETTLGQQSPRDCGRGLGGGRKGGVRGIGFPTCA